MTPVRAFRSFAITTDNFLSIKLETLRVHDAHARTYTYITNVQIYIYVRACAYVLDGTPRDDAQDDTEPLIIATASDTGAADSVFSLHLVRPVSLLSIGSRLT